MKNPAKGNKTELTDARYCSMRLLPSPVHHALMHFAEPSTVQASRQLKGS